MAGNRTRVNCLEGSYAHHYTTNACCKFRILFHVIEQTEVDCIDKVAWYPFFCWMREKRRLPANCCGGKSCLEERKAEGEGSSLPT